MILKLLFSNFVLMSFAYASDGYLYVDSSKRPRCSTSQGNSISCVEAQTAYCIANLVPLQEGGLTNFAQPRDPGPRPTYIEGFGRIDLTEVSCYFEVSLEKCSGKLCTYQNQYPQVCTFSRPLTKQRMDSLCPNQNPWWWPF